VGGDVWGFTPDSYRVGVDEAEEMQWRSQQKFQIEVGARKILHKFYIFFTSSLPKPRTKACSFVAFPD
jgi:hypothetical protein